ncbi:MAG TPA: EAL domain-containing protein [Chloroflexota bacterium]|nr:EAL domain-containing protein [Chloroflexota bacterium]
MPTGVLSRIRWLFLGFTLLNIVGMLTLLTWGSTGAPALRSAGGIACVVLVGAWVLGYRRARFPLPSGVVEFAALLTLTVTVGFPEQALGLIFAAANFRATFGTRRDLAATVLMFVGAYLGGQLIVDAHRFLSGLGSFGPQLIVLPGSAVVMFVLARSLARHERSAARERALAGAGAELMAATSREEAIKAVLAAVLAMLADAGVIVKRASLSASSGPHQMTVTAARGIDADRIHGVHIDLQKAPLGYLSTSPEQRQFAVDAGVAQAMATFLGFPPHPGVITLTPMSMNGVSTGLLVVESAAELPAECVDGLLALSAEAALSLGAIQLTHDLRNDIEQRQALEAQLTHQASHDALTDLPNRTLFARRTQWALDRSLNSGRPVAVLFVDLDGFKTINDSLGHAVGDQLLVELSGRLGAAVMDGTLVARLGGDEFAVLLEDASEPDAATRLAEATLDLLRRPVCLAERAVGVEASIGIATSTPATHDADDLLRNADMAMYAAKRAGKGQSAVYEESMRGALLARLDLEAELRRALDQHEFVVHYQPVLSLAEERLVGVEALVRWQHPRRGLLAPGKFIALAEETGLIVPLGRWVLHQACADVAHWQRTRSDDPPLQLSVNLSSRQLQDPNLAADIAAGLAESRLAPGSLVLEITESLLMHDPAGNATRLQDLRARGAMIAIDDFGTGYSSLAYLLALPIDVLKIDQVFIEHVTANVRSLALTQAMVSLGHSLGLRVVAEGIEHRDQVDLLRELHCDAGQGFYFARPLDAATLTARMDIDLHGAARVEESWPRQQAA